MSKKKIERKQRQNIIIDMNDFIIKYAATMLGENKTNLAQQIYEAGKDNVKGLDKLFNDAGYGRKKQYENIAEGYVCNFYHVMPDQTKPEVDRLTKEAMNYLGSHADEFNRWREE